MRFVHEGMSLWYGTHDAPAPEGAVQSGSDITITIGVQPTYESNKVDVLYRINQGPIETIAAQWLRHDLPRKAYYFRARFPALNVDDTVDYTAICHCAGRQVPSPEEAKQLVSSFHVVAVGSVESKSVVGSAIKEMSMLKTDGTGGYNTGTISPAVVVHLKDALAMKAELLPQDDDPEYRDYLLSVVVRIASSEVNVASEFGPVSDPFVGATQYLLGRFKQDFTTLDNTLIGANRVPIEVLTAALTQDLGVPATNIPLQGPSVADRQYLDTLIQLSGHSLADLSTRYRIDFSRPDSQQTTRVHENIVTLQRYFRDDPPSAFAITSGGTAVDQRFPVNPFFLYKQEWRLRFLTPFFPENFYAFKTGLFKTPALRATADRLVAIIEGQPDILKLDPSRQYGSAAPADVLARVTTMLVVDNHLRQGHDYFAAQEYGLSQNEYTLAVAGIHELAGQLIMYLQDNPNPPIAPSTFGFFPDVSKDADTFRRSLDPTDVNLHPANVIGTRLGLSNIPGGSGQWIDVKNKIIPDTMPYRAALLDYLEKRYDHREVMPITSPQELDDLENLNVITGWTPADVITSGAVPDKNSYQSLLVSLWDLHDQLVSLIPHVMFLLLPVCLGDVAAAQGDFVGALKQYARVAKEHLLRANLLTNPPPDSLPTDLDLSWFPRTGDLPWSWTVGDFAPTLWLDGTDYPYLNVFCEGHFIMLRLGAVYLTWADQLYRSDDEADVYRARELFKAIVAQYTPRGIFGGIPLPKKPHPVPSDLGLPEVNVLNLPSGTTSLPWPSQGDWFRLLNNALSGPNSAITAQETIAQIGITQIDAGLNYYGYSDLLVPTLRYEALVSTAKSFAALAKQAEEDWISFTNQAEAAQLNQIQARFAADIAAKRVDIEKQQVLAANDYVTQAQIQVKHVQDLITKKNKEINDHNSFCGQLSDFVGGIFSTVSKAPKGLTDYVGQDVSAAYSGGEASSSAWAGLGATGAIIGAGILMGVTLSSMADQANARTSDLNDLQNVQLTSANANLDAKLHEFAIAQLQQIIASLQAQATQEVYRFGLLRTLNAETWAYMAATIREILKRYLNLATQTAWLAERALSYEQDRDVRVIRFDYYQAGNRNLLGADALQSDLAQLEGERLAGFRETQPIKWTVSLSRDFPLAFGQLLTTGSCIFKTSSTPLELAYPGSFAHRIRAVEVVAFVPIGQVPRGVLTNPGLSVIQEEELGNTHLLMRDFDAFFLSDFTLKDDMVIYALPSEGLLAFEGSGIDTFWELRLSPAVNSASLALLTDVMLTFRLNARFSDTRRAQLAEAAPKISRSMIFPAKEHFPDAFQQFISRGNDLTFDITTDMLPVTETARTVTNVAVFFGGTNLPVITGQLSSTARPTGAKFKTDGGGLAHSNHLPPPAATVINPPPSTLDVMATGAPDQQWTVSISAGANPHFDRATIGDVWLGIEYSAQPQFPKS